MQVSVLTLTNYTRVKELELLLLNIIEQSVKIDELFILETDYIPENIKKSKENIERLYSVYEKQINFKMVYYIHDYDHNIEYVKSLSDAELIKIGNERTNGNIIFRMFDDTYYFPNYIEENIKILNNSDKQLNYCSNPCLYDSLINRYIKTDISKINKMYSSTLVYKKEFINNNDEIRINDINNFNNIDSLFIKIINENNYEYYRNDYFEKLLSNEDINIKLPNRYNTINKVLNNDNVSYDNEYVSHDIVYLNGYHTIVWNPEDKSLGGSEQAIVKLSEEWVKLNKTVAVYGNFNFMKKTINDVDYYNISLLPIHKKFKNLISWRTQGIFMLSIFNLNIDNLFIDFHDNFSYTLEKLNIDGVMSILEKAKYIMLKSVYHKDCFEEYLNKYNKKLVNPKILICMNGLRINEFSNKPKGVIRKPYRFCYCSSYDRGLAIILKYIWPHIYNKEPNAELHIYYGMDYLFDEEGKKVLTYLMGQPGVMDHGRKPLETIIEEKYTSSFHLYLCTCDAEIDCISIRESLVTGCIPIMYDYGVFKERDGLKYYNELNEENCKIIADDIVFKMKNIDLMEKCSNSLKLSETIISWNTIAEHWVKLFG
jgi:hypothetical protein